MKLIISFGDASPQERNKAEKKSRYTRELFDDYVVVDLETTGLMPGFDEIIEVAILRVRDGKIVDTYQTLVKPKYEIDEYITELTGITNEMVADAPDFESVAPAVFDFIGDDPIIGHNVSFDIGFLNENQTVTNPHGDTMHLARKVFPELKNHKLTTISEYLDIAYNAHRAEADSVATHQVYEQIKSTLEERGITIDSLYTKTGKKYEKWDPKNYSQSDRCAVDLTSIETDPDNYFYGMHCCFTGKMEKLTRKDAWQLLTQIGGIPDKTVGKATNFLVLGNLDLPRLPDQKSNKQKSAESKKAKGQDIEIITEQQFYELIDM